MRISQIQQYKPINSSFSRNNDADWTSYPCNDDSYVGISSVLSKKQKLKGQLELSTDTLKKNLWFSKGMFTKRNLNAFISDPKPYLYEYKTIDSKQLKTFLFRIQSQNNATINGIVAMQPTVVTALITTE